MTVEHEDLIRLPVGFRSRFGVLEGPNSPILVSQSVVLHVWKVARKISIGEPESSVAA